MDVCRFWQELGYLLIYVTGRPDMQQQRVLSWLSQHNFPHGLVSFADGQYIFDILHTLHVFDNSVINSQSQTFEKNYFLTFFLLSFVGLSLSDPLGHKTAYLNNLIQNQGVNIQAAYGSSKDIAIYTHVGLKPKQIYIVGKVLTSNHFNYF